ncbi:MAG: polyprenyl synthetase family protein [Opitutales bacterium]
MAIHDQLAYSERTTLLEAVRRRIAEDFALDCGSAGQGRVDGAFLHHFEAPGKQTRPTLTIEASRALGLDAGVAVGFGACIEALHNASLVQDDLQDCALERRGRPSIHSLFGKDVALGLATRLVSAAFLSLSTASRLLASPSGEGELGVLATGRAHRAISETIDGQSRDLDPRADRSVENLLTIARQKSGPLFSLALELPLIAAGHLASLERAREAACRLGLGYQIIDDVKDRQIDRLQAADANIVNALAQSAGPDEACRQAIDLARSELARSRELAAGLPSSSGAHLRAMADDLLDHLKNHRE